MISCAFVRAVSLRQPLWATQSQPLFFELDQCFNSSYHRLVRHTTKGVRIMPSFDDHVEWPLLGVDRQPSLARQRQITSTRETRIETVPTSLCGTVASFECQKHIPPMRQHYHWFPVSRVRLSQPIACDDTIFLLLGSVRSVEDTIMCRGFLMLSASCASAL